jgi:hypothetical protein
VADVGQLTDEHGDPATDEAPTEVRVELSEVAGTTRMVMTHEGGAERADPSWGPDVTVGGGR